jgi:hypothetical protein
MAREVARGRSEQTPALVALTGAAVVVTAVLALVLILGFLVYYLVD